MICIVFDRDGMAGVLLDDHVKCPCNFIGLIRFQLFYFCPYPRTKRKGVIFGVFFLLSRFEWHQLPNFDVGPLASLGLDFPHLGVG